MGRLKYLAVTAAAAALFATSIVAAGALVEEPTQINACVNAAGVLQITDGAECNGNSTAVSWNAEGIQGEPGVDGIDGVDGLPGAPGVDGVDGVDGINGVSGFVSVSQFAQAYATSGANVSVTAYCPAGKVAVGGGGVSGAVGTVITDTYPAAGSTGWSTHFDYTGPTRWVPMTAWVQCVSV